MMPQQQLPIFFCTPLVSGDENATMVDETVPVHRRVVYHREASVPMCLEIGAYAKNLTLSPR